MCILIVCLILKVWRYFEDVQMYLTECTILCVWIWSILMDQLVENKLKYLQHLALMNSCSIFLKPELTNWIRNTLKPTQKGRFFADDIFKHIFLNENVRILIEFHWSLFLRVQLTIMAWRRRGNKPLTDPMVVSLLTHWRSNVSASQ